jgi:hypothetical protein
MRNRVAISFFFSLQYPDYGLSKIGVEGSEPSTFVL